MPHFDLACHLHEKPVYELRRGMLQSPVSVELRNHHRRCCDAGLLPD